MNVRVEAADEQSFRVTAGPFSVAYTAEGGSIDVSREGAGGTLSIAPGGHSSGLGVLRPENVGSVSLDEDEDGVTAVIDGHVDAGPYELIVRFPEDAPGLVDYRLTVAGDDGVSLPAGTAELIYRGTDGGSAEVVDYLSGRPDTNSAGGTDDINEFIFVGLPDGLDATLLAAVDYGALDDFFAETDADMYDLVDDPPGPFGYAVPNSGTASPAAGTVVAANVLALAPGSPSIDEPIDYTKQFVKSLSEVYDRIDRPDPERIDWPAVADAGARDLAREANRHEEDGVWHPGGVELVSTMSVVVPYRRYADAFESESARALLEPMPELLRTYHDGEFEAASGSRGMLANTPNSVDLGHADTWYFLWGLIQVGEAARQTGNEVTTGRFLDAADVAVDLARAVEYVFPRWVDVGALEAVVPASSDEGKFQYDCTGAYVYLALQYHELTGEERYLDEAKAAADRLMEMGFEYPFEFNTTAIGPAALQWLSEETGEERYLEGSYIPLASVLRHAYFFAPDHGEFAGRRVFLLNSAMPAETADSNYYANALEEDALLIYLEQYLRGGFDDLSSAARDLVGELLRHKGTSLADSLAPLHTDSSLVADSMSPQSGRRVNPEWHLPLEPFGVLGSHFDELGAVAQSLYGTGAYASAATMQYHQLSPDLTLYTECAVEVERETPSRHTVRPLGGDRAFSATLLGPPDAVLDLAVREADGASVDLSYDPDEEGYHLELRGGRQYRFERTVAHRSVVVERLEVTPQPVSAGEPFDVTVVYRNTSPRGGHYETEIQIGDDKRTVSAELDAGDTERVSVSTTVNEPGSHTIQTQRTRCRLNVEPATGDEEE